MLVACRLAGLYALETHYAGGRAGAQFGPTRAALARGWGGRWVEFAAGLRLSVRGGALASFTGIALRL